MDILPSPPGAAPVAPTPYVGDDAVRWDGGSFLHFACRRSWLANVPPHLRRCDCSIQWRDRRYYEPIAAGEKERFLQTWLFFGLLAELYGHNDEEGPAGCGGGTATASTSDSKTAGIEALYGKFVRPAEAESLEGGGSGGATATPTQGEKYLTAAVLDDPQEAQTIIEHFRRRHRAGGPGALVAYVNRFYDALRFVNGMVNHLSTVGPEQAAGFRASVWVSIAALGELCTSLLQVLAPAFGLPRDTIRGGAGIWGGQYLSGGSGGAAAPGGGGGGGWCSSDVERVRQTFYGLATRQFLSRMRKPPVPTAGGGEFSHKRCGLQMCLAGQIDPRTYKLTHAEGCGGCDILEAKQEEVKSILRRGNSFPVLWLEVVEEKSGGGKGTVTMHVEEYTPDKRYIALSHVWADGLGNQTANTLQSCQIYRLAQLIRKLPPPNANDETAGGSERTRSDPGAYWFWIDTLCCPIDRAEKNIALERIADVYVRADHVLVLDKAISAFEAAGDGPAKAAENCLRIVGLTTWMRRLWTLQEGALAKSLYFQFRDKAISLHLEATRLSAFAAADLRYKVISDAVLLEIHRLASLCKPQPASGEAADHTISQLESMQSCLYFRSVSFASDEPLCITTLLSLNPQPLVADSTTRPCRQRRMAQVWEMVAARSANRFPARVIFHNDQRLGLTSLAGRRWAPRSLLPRLETGISFISATTRFWFSKAGIGNSGRDYLGTVTPRGLKVSFPGKRIRLKPWGGRGSSSSSSSVGGGRVWPWSLVTRHVIEGNLFCRDVGEGCWFSLSDQVRGEHIADWTWGELEKDKELLEADKKRPREGERPSQPIFNELVRPLLNAKGEENGNGAAGHVLIRDVRTDDFMSGRQSDSVHLLARIQDEATIQKDAKEAAAAAAQQQQEEHHVHACLTVTMSRLPEAVWPGMDRLRAVAAEVFASDINRELLRFLDSQPGGMDPGPKDAKCEHLIAELKKEMERAAQAALGQDTGGHLEQVTREFLGDGKRDDVWKLLSFQFPYQLDVEEMTGEQTWVVDGPVVGDGTCQDACCLRRDLPQDATPG